MEIDYATRTVALHLDVHASTVRTAVLKLEGLLFLIVDPPGPNALLSGSSNPDLATP